MNTVRCYARGRGPRYDAGTAEVGIGSTGLSGAVCAAASAIPNCMDAAGVSSAQ